MKKQFIILLLALICIVILLIVFLHPIDKRIDILTDYRELLSDQNAVERLESVPPIKKWNHESDDKPVSIGYASFSFPFGEIFTISEEHKRVIIDSDKVKVHFSLMLLDDFSVDLEHPGKYLPYLIYKGGTFKVRDEKYQQYDIALAKHTLNIPRYEFHKEIHKLTPKPIISLLFMDFDDLYLYERLLEIKNSNLWGGEVFLFETDNLKGMVERLDRMEEEHNYASCHIVLAWDLENKIYQLVQIISYVEEVTEDKIQQFVSSLTYDMDVIESNADDLRPVILKALRNYKFYTPEAQEVSESSSADD